MTDKSGECRAALDSRLPMTWTMRLRSAITKRQVRLYLDCEIVPAPGAVVGVSCPIH